MMHPGLKLPLARLAGLALLASLSLGAQAAIFGDDEARRAILDLRQRLETLNQRQSEEAEKNKKDRQALANATEDNAQLRRSLLDLSNQIEQLRAEVSRLRGQDEQMAREVAEVQRRLKDVSNGAEDRLRRVEDSLRSVEPSKVSVDGREFLAEPGESRDYDAALAFIRKGDFARAQSVFSSFVQRYPVSGYKASALFWLGNAQYAMRNYKEALASLRSMLLEAPDHARAPEAMLAVANAQFELKEPRPAVRKTLEDLVRAYPQTEAAAVAQDRLSKLK